MIRRCPAAPAIEDRGERARGARYAVRIHERDWLSDDRRRLERLLASFATITLDGNDKREAYAGKVR